MDKDSKIIAELEKLYSGVEGWDEKERRDHIITAYHYIKKQQEQVQQQALRQSDRRSRQLQELLP